MAYTPPPQSGNPTIASVFDQKKLWKWWEQNNGRGTNLFNGITEKGMDYSADFGTPIGVPVGGKILRIVPHTNSIGDVVELQATDGSVWLYQHITATVKVGQTLGVGGVVGTENGLPVDQYSTGPHIEVRYCKPGTWNPGIDSWNEPWINPYMIFSNLSNTMSGGPIDSNGIPSVIVNTALGALAPNSNVSALLYSIDQFMQVKNPFDTSQETIQTDSFLGNSFPDPVGWVGTVGTNVFNDAAAVSFRLVLMVTAVFILYNVVKKFIDVGSITNTAINAGKSIALLGAL